MSAACAGGIAFTLENARRWRQRAASSPAGDIAYQKMEEGECAAPPPHAGMSDATWNLVNTIIMCLMTVIGIAMLAYVLVSRLVYRDPEMQDPSVMVLLVALSLCVMGVGYVPTLAKYCEEMESNDDQNIYNYMQQRK